MIRTPHVVLSFYLSPAARWLSVTLLPSILLLVGCNTDGGSYVGPLEADTTRVSKVEFTQAIDRLAKIEEVETQLARRDALASLNRWIESADVESRWRKDPMTSRRPPHLKNLTLFKDAARRQFGGPDAIFLQEAIYLREIERWASEQPLDELLKSRFEETVFSEKADHDARGKLQTALRLFDWTVRNIQLEPQPDIASSALSMGIRNPPSRLEAPRRAVKGPGYWLFPLQALQYGRGDALIRASVFMLLCRQAELRTLLIAVDEQPLPRPWACGVLIGKELFLFDAALGLPLPGPQENGVATLAQVIADPSLLRQLDVRDNQREETMVYPVDADDLQDLVGLVYASEAQLSERMKILEISLTGKNKMKLTVEPSALVLDLQRWKVLDDSPKGLLKRAALWSVPLEARIYRYQLQQRAKENPASVQEHFEEEQLFLRTIPLVRGRYAYFRGEFETQDTAESGAKPLYLLALMPERAINAMDQSQEAQELLGLGRQEGEPEMARQQKIREAQRMLRLSKSNASYWLGLLQYETGQFEAGAYWLKVKTLEADQSSRWKSGARYNLGRVYEAMEKYDQAKAIYRSEDDAYSPQRHGNLLRSRWIESQSP